MPRHNTRDRKSYKAKLGGWKAVVRPDGIHPAQGQRLRNAPFLPASWAYFSSDDKASGKALEAVKRLPPEGQDQIAMAMLTLSGNEGAPEEIDAAHPPSVLEGLAQAKRRPFARDADVEAALRRFDR